jgi:MFS family permease
VKVTELPSRLNRLYKEYPRPFWVLISTTFIDRLGGALIFPFFALYITKRFGVGMVEVGILFAFFSISSFMGTFLGGGISDRFGRKGILVFSLIATSLSNVAMGLVNTMEAFFLLALTVGILTDAGVPASQAVVADLLPEKQRAQGFGLLRVVVNLAVAIGPVIGGILATRSYLMLFIADAVISLLAAGLVISFLPETKPVSLASKAREPLGRTFLGYLQVLKDRLFVAFVGASVLSVLIYMNLNTTLGVYLRDQHGIAESGYGMIISLNAIMVVLFQFPITRRIENLPPMRMMAIGTCLYGIGFALYGLFQDFILFLLAMAIITIGEMVFIPVSQALCTKLAPVDMRGRYMAVYGFSWGIPYAIGPLAAGYLMDQYDPNWLWVAAGFLGLISTSVFLMLHRMKMTKERLEMTVG